MKIFRRINPEDYYNGECFEDGGVIKIRNKGLIKTKNIITNVIGYPEETADYLIDLDPKRAVWLADSILKQRIYEEFNEKYPDGTFYNYKELNKILENIKNNQLQIIKDNPKLIKNLYGQDIRMILDWLINPTTPKQNLRELTFKDAIEKSKKWHSKLTASGGDIDFNEPKENAIIKTYPINPEGVQYYWVHIPKSYCSTEQERMGHCGSTGGDSLISLRSHKPFSDDKKISDSHVTIAYYEGYFIQVKGKQNRKPIEKYHYHIFDLIKTLLNNDLDYFLKEIKRIEDLCKNCEEFLEEHKKLINFGFKGFGSEYDASEDYGWEDMTKDELSELYKIKPELFSSFLYKILLYQKGVISNKPNTTFIYETDCDGIEELVDLNRDLRDDFIEKVICGDFYDFFDGYYYNFSEDEILKYYFDDLNEENQKIISKKIAEITNIDLSVIEEKGNLYYLSGKYLEDYEGSEEYDFTDIFGAINSVLNSSIEIAYYDYYYKEIKDALSKYGDVISLDSNGLKIKIDILDIFDYSTLKQIWLDYDFADNQPLSDIFLEGVTNYKYFNKRPIISIDDRYVPPISNKLLNENFYEFIDFRKGGSLLSNTLSIAQVENNLGRKIHWWNDDIVTINGIKYKKVYLQPYYKKIKK